MFVVLSNSGYISNSQRSYMPQGLINNRVKPSGKEINNIKRDSS